MLPVRIAFDPALPVVASQGFTAGGRTFKDGDPFPWSEVGLDEPQLHSFWRSGLVSFLPSKSGPIVSQDEAPQRKRRAAR